MSPYPECCLTVSILQQHTMLHVLSARTCTAICRRSWGDHHKVAGHHAGEAVGQVAHCWGHRCTYTHASVNVRDGMGQKRP
eukprot:scaffold140551_cov23-Tisochrysis_lutea.AAC.1